MVTNKIVIRISQKAKEEKENEKWEQTSKKETKKP